MAISTATEYTAMIDEKWDADIEKARYSDSKLLKRVLSKSDKVKQSGDKINMTVNTRLTVGSVTAGTGAFSARSTTPTAVVLTVDQWKEVNLNTTNLALAQAFWTPESTFPQDAGAALAEEYDRYIASIGATGSTIPQIGEEGGAVPVNNSNIRSALLILADNRVPFENLTLAVRPKSLLIDLLSETVYTQAYAIGGGEKTPLITGKIDFQAVGCEVVQTVEIAEINGVYKSLLFHKSAIAFGMQKEHEFERFSLAATSVAGRGVLMTSLYGAKILRGDHIVIINSTK